MDTNEPIRYCLRILGHEGINGTDFVSAMFASAWYAEKYARLEFPNVDPKAVFVYEWDGHMVHQIN